VTCFYVKNAQENCRTILFFDIVELPQTKQYTIVKKLYEMTS